MGGRVVSPIHLFSKRSHVAEASGALSDSGLEHKSKSKSAESSPAQSQKQATVKKYSLPLPKSVSRVVCPWNCVCSRDDLKEIIISRILLVHVQHVHYM